jgi:hypothetical protein
MDWLPPSAVLKVLCTPQNEKGDEREGGSLTSGQGIAGQ